LILAAAAGLALADASIVTLGLPQILRDLNTTVEGVAAVIGVYTIVLAVALIPLERAATNLGARSIGATGFVVFAVASVAAASANDLTGLLIARSVQALGGAAGLVAAFSVIAADERSARRLWIGAAVVATAFGPALGGALTQLFDWRAIFVFSVPFGAAAAVACLAGPRIGAPGGVTGEHEPFEWRPALALILVSAALAAVLFLLVLELVAGFGVSPLRGALTVTVLPLAALVATRIGGPAGVRACAGCALVAGGVLALAWLPDSSAGWTIIPQALAGVGMGLAFTSLGGELLPERTAYDAARLLTLRHIGIAAILAILAPIAAHELNVTTEKAREEGVALVLDAQLSPQKKLSLAPALLKGVDSANPRRGLSTAVDKERPGFTGSDLVAFDDLAKRADETLVNAVIDAFRTAYLVTGLIGALAFLLLLPSAMRIGSSAAAALAGAGVLMVLAPVAYVVAHNRVAPAEVAIQDPCHANRQTPGTGGITGFLQDQALKLLDTTACRVGSSREELVLALADKSDAKRFQKEHGVNPRSVGGLLGALIGGGGGG